MSSTEIVYDYGKSAHDNLRQNTPSITPYTVGTENFLPFSVFSYDLRIWIPFRSVLRRIRSSFTVIVYDLRFLPYISVNDRKRPWSFDLGRCPLLLQYVFYCWSIMRSWRNSFVAILSARCSLYYAPLQFCLSYTEHNLIYEREHKRREIL